MKLYDKKLIEAIVNILTFHNQIELSLLGKEIKSYLKQINYNFYQKKKIISPNTYIKYKFKNLLNFISYYKEIDICKKTDFYIISLN